MGKTTWAGLFTILAGASTFLVALLTDHPIDLVLVGALVTAIAAGIGLMKAKDAAP